MRLIEAGADVFRLNFSHADRDRHARTIEAIRAAAEQVGREVAVLGDLPGPKLRIGELRDDVAELETGMHVKLTPQEVEGDAETIPVAWPGVTSLREDELVYLADGSIRLRVRGPEDGGVDCEVEVGGTLSSHKGMNVPGDQRPRRRPTATWAGSSSRSSTASTCWRSPSSRPRPTSSRSTSGCARSTPTSR